MTDPELSKSQPVRYSNLKLFARSPAHYIANLRTEREDSRAMRIGRGVHAMVLGGKYDLFEGSDRRAKGWKEFEANAKTDTVLTYPEYMECKRIADAVKGNTDAVHSLTGINEFKVEWTFKNRACRSTPDCYNSLDGRISDLKTCQDSSPDEFKWTIKKNYYTEQLAFYRLALGEDNYNTFRVVAVESSAPYNVVVYNIPEMELQKAKTNVLTWFSRLLGCESTGVFPGYADSIVEYEP